MVSLRVEALLFNVVRFMARARRVPFWALACVGVILLPASFYTSTGSQVVEMSFEQAAQAADIVVLSTVIENPELGAVEPSSGVVVHSSRVRVDQYLKGSGANEIEIQTIGGSFISTKNGHPERMTQIAGGQPQLPEAGSRVLLFLTRYGGSGAYMICSASHGIRPILRPPGATEDTVNLAFERPDLMTSRAAADFNRAKAAGPISPGEFFHGDVPIAELHDLVARAVAPVPKPRPSAPPPN